MRILWVVNHKMRDLALELGEKPILSGSWLIDISKLIAEKNENKLYVVCPSNSENIRVEVNDIVYYTLRMKNYDKFIKPSKSLFKAAESLMEEVKPDIIHIQGSEFAFNLAFLRSKSIPTLLSIQGLISQITNKNYFYAGINDKKYRKSYFDKLTMIFPEHIKMIRNKFRARSEIKQIKSCCNIAGRTSWDHANTYFINKDAKYFHLQETIRSSFFEHDWSYSKLEKYSIFAAGGFSSPLKGFHKILESVILLRDEFPNILIKVPGPDLLNKRSSLGYNKLLYDFIKVNKLENNIRFLGNLDDQQMAYEFSTAHVYVMGSSIENSSNTLGEAMTVGTPSVVSFVGGTSSLITDEIEGLYYRFGDVKHMAWQIRRLLSDNKYAGTCSRNAKERARKQYSNTNSYIKLFKVYEEIVSSNSGNTLEKYT